MQNNSYIIYTYDMIYEYIYKICVYICILCMYTYKELFSKEINIFISCTFWGSGQEARGSHPLPNSFFSVNKIPI